MDWRGARWPVPLKKKDILKAFELFDFITITCATLMVILNTDGSADVDVFYNNITTTCHAISTRIFHLVDHAMFTNSVEDL